MIGHVTRTMATALTFVAALVAGAVLHLDAPAVRRVVSARVNGVLATALPGRIAILDVGHIGAGRVSGVRATVQDPEGRTVLQVEGLRAQLETGRLLASLAHGDDLAIDLTELAADEVDVNLDADDSGALRVSRAFAAAKSTAPPAPPGRGVRVHIPTVTLAHVVVRGQPTSPIAVDAQMGDLAASVDVSPGSVAMNVSRAQVTATAVPGVPALRGTLAGSLAVPAPTGADLAAEAHWKGTIGSIAGSIDARYDTGQVTATVDMPGCAPNALRELWPACSFTEPVSVHAEAHGKLPDLSLVAHASVGSGTLEANGNVTIGDETRAAVHLDTTAIDLRALVANAPASSLGAKVDARAVLRQGSALEASATVDAAAGTVATVPTPRVTATMNVMREASGSTLIADASATVHEPGAPIIATVHLGKSGDALKVAFDARTDVALDAIPRIRTGVRGRAQLRTHGTLVASSGRVDAQLDASASSLSAGPVGVDGATVHAHVTGLLRDPSIDADMSATGVALGPLRVESVDSHVSGPASGPQVSLALHAHGGEHEARLQAERVSFANGTVEVSGGEIIGFGAPIHAQVRISPAELYVCAHSRGTQLGRIAHFTGSPDLAAGRVSFDVDGTLRPDSAKGHLSIDLAEGKLGTWSGSDAHVEATLEGRSGSARVTAKLPDIGSFDLSAQSIQLRPGSPLRAAAWRGAWGAANLTAHVDLGKLAARLPAGTLPVSAVSGSVDVQGHVARDSSQDMSPDIDVTAKTSGLLVDGPTGKPWQLRGVDTSARVRVDGQTGDARLDAELDDAHGVLLAVVASSSAVPYARFITGDADLAGAVRTMPFTAQVTLPARDLGDLPALLGTKGGKGDLAATVTWSGALTSPTIDAHATLSRGHVDPRLLALPLDLDLSGHYDGAHATAKLVATARDKPVLEGDASVDVQASDVLDGGAVPWTGAVHATLSRFPLQSLAALDNRQVRGRASGTVALEGLHSDARGSVDLSLDSLQVGDVACRDARLKGSFDGRMLDASVRVDEQDGWAEAHAQAGAKWGAAMAPTVDPSQPVSATLTTKQFRAALLLPFMSSVFTELDGRVDANARIDVDPAAKSIKPQGSVRLTGGVFELASVGGEFHDATATLSLTPDGIVSLQQVKAKGISGEVDAAATARFTGLAFAGARGVIQVSKRAPLPLVFEGVQVGTFDGHVDLDVAPGAAGAGLDVKVGLPTALLELPLTAAHDVQQLGALDGAYAGLRDASGKFVPANLGADAEPNATASGTGASAMRVTVMLGKDVEIRRGTDLDVHLEGSPSFAVSNQVHATGQVRLSRGSIQVQGKTFSLDNATVTFVDDPTNPQVVLTASWPAPDGTVVYADFVGPLKTGKVTLRSEPAHTQNEILSLILFGTTDQQVSSQTGASPGASTAAGAAGGAATAPINRALGGVNQMLDNFGLAGGISTKIDTSQATPRPEVELQIARDISIQVAWVLGVPPPGTNPDTTLFTLDWRFLRNWSLETTVGDAGTSILDLVWQHRY
jgi:translocation and assembly module TamB